MSSTYMYRFGWPVITVITIVGGVLISNRGVNDLWFLASRLF